MNRSQFEDWIHDSESDNVINSTTAMTMMYLNVRIQSPHDGHSMWGTIKHCPGS